MEFVQGCGFVAGTSGGVLPTWVEDFKGVPDY